MKVDKIFSILNYSVNTNLNIWCWILEALMKQDESQGCLNTNNYKGPALKHSAGKGGCREEGA